METEHTTTEEAEEPRPLPRLARWCLTLFIAFHLVSIALWALPLNASLTRLVQKKLGPYFSLMGLRQEWSLFAPDPISANSYVDAQVILENGDLRTWSFPRLQGLEFQERYSRARYRKFVGWLYRRNYSYAWRDAARYVARQFKSSAIPPRSVKLVRHWAPVRSIDDDDDDPMPEWQSNVFFVYQIPAGGLE